MTEFTEDRVYARHRRRTGAVLIVGVGAVGGFLAEELARLGFSPIRLVDPDVLEAENLIRHPLGAWAVGQAKASTLGSKITRDFPLCDAAGLDADFQLPPGQQLRLAAEADVVVAATDSANCQRRVNEVALAAEKPAVYPAVWVDPRVRDAEVGEILWVLPGRHTPCYECAVAFRQAAADAQAARGARVDIQLVALTTAQVVAALLDPADERSAILDPERTAIYIHGLTPTSPGVRATFPNPGLQSRPVRVPIPPTRCPACGGQDPTARRGAARAALRPVRPPRPARAARRQVPVQLALLIVAVVMILLVALIVGLAHRRYVVVPSEASAPSAPASRTAAPGSGSTRVVIRLGAACKWAYPGRATGETSGSAYNIVCLDANGQSLGGFTDGTGHSLNDWCADPSHTGGNPELIQAKLTGRGWVCTYAGD